MLAPCSSRLLAADRGHGTHVRVSDEKHGGGVTLRPVVGGGPSIPPLLAGVPWGCQGPKETVLSSDCCARAWLQLKATVRGVRCFLLVSGNLQIGLRVTGYSPH